MYRYLYILCTFASTVLATLSIRTASQGGSFAFYTLSLAPNSTVFRMQYSKKVYTIEEHISLLKKRGLHFTNESLAKKYLQNISYYRLAGYWWSMQADKETHTFKPNSTFSNVIDLYNFDAELRILLFDVIEKIEISLRTKLIYHLSHEFGAWWFQDFSIFENSQALVKTLENLREEIERSKDVFIKEHKKKYKK